MLTVVLQTADSLYVLGTDDGWFGAKAIEALEFAANAPYNTTAKFEELFECDPTKEHYGFSSWDGKGISLFPPLECCYREGLIQS